MIQLEDFQRFSLYTFFLSWIVYFNKDKLPYYFIQIVQSLVLIVAFAVYYIYLRYGFKSIIAFYNRVIPFISNPILIIFIDSFFHLLPVFLVCLPTNIPSIIIAYEIIISWYILVRTKISKLYLLEIPLNEYDQLLSLFIPFILSIYILIINLLNLSYS